MTIKESAIELIREIDSTMTLQWFPMEVRRSIAKLRDVVGVQEPVDHFEDKAFDVACRVHDMTFCLLDTLQEIDGAIAGEIAKQVQDVVERELRHELGGAL